MNLPEGTTRISGETRPVQPSSSANEAVAEFQARLEENTKATPAGQRELLAAARKALASRFLQGEAVEALVSAEAGLVDVLITYLWRRAGIADDVTLVAVGGFGRGELQPCSDVDILVLLPASDAPTDAITTFVTSLWDTGLEIGHSVRTVADCQREAGADVTIATTLMESRVLAGPAALFTTMLAATASDQIWPSREFFTAKREEQRLRHRRYGDTGYNLEPNVKGSPGGLRDIQMVGWVAQRHFGSGDLEGLRKHGFLSAGQLEKLLQGRHFLWTLRYALHVLTGRREDRLLFDHQKTLASMLGYEDARFTLGVEQMMQRYYRTVMDLSRLNEMLLQQFEE
ncbi:MAG: nucleotidyltransferase domain-containing protein, partial [Pseudomonadota bacterium]